MTMLIKSQNQVCNSLRVNTVHKAAGSKELQSA